MSFLRDMTPADYAEVDRLLGRLHAIHVAGRPDIYEPVANPYIRERYEAMVADSGMLTFLACDEAGRVQGICLVTLRDQNGMRRKKTPICRPWWWIAGIGVRELLLSCFGKRNAGHMHGERYAWI